MTRDLHSYWHAAKIIPAVRRPEDLEEACLSPWPIIFLLIGDLMSAEEYIEQAKAAGKQVFLHVDFISGLGGDPIVMKYVAERFKPAGVISTKSHFVKHAKKQGLMAIQRIFTIDTSALEHGIQNIAQSAPDAVEVMPGLLPKVISRLSASTKLPIIAGGLIQERSEIEAAWRAGASAVSMGAKKLWV